MMRRFDLDLFEIGEGHVEFVIDLEGAGPPVTTVFAWYWLTGAIESFKEFVPPDVDGYRVQLRDLAAQMRATQSAGQATSQGIVLKAFALAFHHPEHGQRIRRAVAVMFYCEGCARITMAVRGDDVTINDGDDDGYADIEADMNEWMKKQKDEWPPPGYRDVRVIGPDGEEWWTLEPEVQH